jgi:hypothetical protein
MSIFKGIRKLFSTENVANAEQRKLQRKTTNAPSEGFDFRLVGSKSEGLKLAGTSNYQTEIKRHAGPAGEHGVDKSVRVLLQEDPKNQYDPDAVKATIQGKTIGFLPAAKAKDYRKQIRDAGV